MLKRCNLFDFPRRLPAEGSPLFLPFPQSYLLTIDQFRSLNSKLFSALLLSDCTFTVEIIKGPRGLGLSVSGGVDSSAPYPGLVRIKRLFPHQAAWATGKLIPGDILLEANGIILTGLTNNVRKSFSTDLKRPVEELLLGVGYTSSSMFIVKNFSTKVALNFIKKVRSHMESTAKLSRALLNKY